MTESLFIMKVSGSLLVVLLFVAGCSELEDRALDGCQNGAEGCPCRSSGRCYTLADGTQLICVDELCVSPDCIPGESSRGCTCEQQEDCAEGLVCVNGNCATDTGQTLVPPESPRCYTPCRGGYTRTDGTYVPCSSEGLLEGCIGDAVCVAGSCVVPSERGLGGGGTGGHGGAAHCDTPTDCPEFQACIQNGCYSDCESDSQCHPSRQCVMKVCRLPCNNADETPCPDGEYCDSDNGQTGFCKEMSVGATPSAPIDGRFELSEKRIELSSRPEHTTASFSITNLSERRHEFHVRKVSHTEFTSEGTTIVSESPLQWLELGDAGGTELVQELDVDVPGGASVGIAISGFDNPLLNRWEGILAVSNSHAGEQEIRLSYTRSPEGQWSGRVYYFATWDEKNAFMARWGDLRNKYIDVDEFQAVLTATLTESWRWPSVQARCPSESEPNPEAACYLYDNNTGIETYSDNIASMKIPTGVVDLPMVMNIRPDASAADPTTTWTGRIVSSESLQYAGDPAVDLVFASDPGDCSQAREGRSCITFIESFQADVYVGGRYETTASDAGCGGRPGFVSVKLPWLVPGFEADTFEDPSDQMLYRYECRDTRFPFAIDESDPSSTSLLALNKSLAASNPIPDGATRQRNLRLAEITVQDELGAELVIEAGAIIDQTTMYLIFKEEFPSFLSFGDPISAHGIIELRRTDAALASDDYQGSRPDAPASLLGIEAAACSQDLLEEFFGDYPEFRDISRLGVDVDTADVVGRAVLEGIIQRDENTEDYAITPNSLAHTCTPDTTLACLTQGEKVHYYCEDTDTFDAGARDFVSDVLGACDDAAQCPAGWLCLGGNCVGSSCLGGVPCPDPYECNLDTMRCGLPAQRHPCPQGSNVEFFTLTGPGATQKEVANLPCQSDPSTSCFDTLQRWKMNGTHDIRWDLVWECEDDDAISCNINRLDLRANKIFYNKDFEAAVALPLDLEIENAFRYKTKFRNRSGTNIGFAPDMCVPDSNAVPYCYDPPSIEMIRARIDCAAYVYTEYYNDLDLELRTDLRNFLVRSFSYGEEWLPGLATPIVHDGFERLYSELLVMMGDEAYTSAFRSRFDLAGLHLASFRGDLLEPEGLNLSGGAGYEMFSLYLATQYYQTALDRFYRLSPLIGQSLVLEKQAVGQGFITPETVTTYFSRLIRASAQKTRALSEIATRYQGFNRPELARLVIERAYTSAYLESIVISNLMRTVVALAPSYADQINQEIETSQRTYRSALLDMRNVYADIKDNQTLFGFDADYIPFPAINWLEYHAFQVTMERARSKLATAAEKELIALEDNRDFETDEALFQAELAELDINYETLLGDVCGTFSVPDGGETVVYPAIPKYAHLNEHTALMGDPCGTVGNGDLHEALVELDMAINEFDQIKQHRIHLAASVKGLDNKLSEQCSRIHTFAATSVVVKEGIFLAEAAIASLDYLIEASDRFTTVLTTGWKFAKCVTGGADSCIISVAAVQGTAPFLVVNFGTWAAAEAAKAPLLAGIAELEIGLDVYGIEQECIALGIDTKYQIAALLREHVELEIEVRNVIRGIDLALSKVQRLRNDATALLANHANTAQQLISVEATRNDPNVRIYRNDAIINADRTFRLAVREAYRATKVFEYYTSQSYEGLDKLFLVRMVSHGDYSLESYLDELDEAFVEFEESYGLPDTRVMVVSLRDDILRIDRLDSRGIALSEAERTELLREAIQDPLLLDPRGYIVKDFATTLDVLSPLTRNHKIRYVEAAIIGDDTGDDLGRVYLQQRGTGVVRRMDGGKEYFTFPERTAVIDTFFNGERIFTDEVYKTERLRDRPVANTGWRMVFNQRDEAVNKDILLSSLTDIVFYIYYTDFTEL